MIAPAHSDSSSPEVEAFTQRRKTAEATIQHLKLTMKRELLIRQLAAAVTRRLADPSVENKRDLMRALGLVATIDILHPGGKIRLE